MFEPRSLPTIALVVEPTETCDPSQLEWLARQLSTAQIRASWIFANWYRTQLFAKQWDESMLESCGLRCETGDLPRMVAEFSEHRAATIPVELVACDMPFPRADLPKLYTLGIRAILSKPPGKASVQRTSEGIWQFGENLSTEGQERFFARALVGQLDRHQAGQAVVRIDLSAAQTARGLRRTKQLIDRLCERQGEQFSVVNLSDVAASLEARTVPRPQRSILRAA